MRNEISGKTVNILKAHKIQTPKQVLELENRDKTGRFCRHTLNFVQWRNCQTGLRLPEICIPTNPKPKSYCSQYNPRFTGHKWNANYGSKCV